MLHLSYKPIDSERAAFFPNETNQKHAYENYLCSKHKIFVIRIQQVSILF